MTDNNIPVVFVNKKYKVGKYYKDILVNTITGSKEIKLYKVNGFKIKINEKYIEKDVYISFTDLRWDALFGEALLGG